MSLPEIRQANAKVNIGLKIIDKLPNGYHSLYSYFQEISLSDTLTFEKLTSAEILLTSTGIPIPGDTKNLVVKAAELLQKTFDVPQGVRIRLQKKIPIGSGLGGGSSDAAETLKALNALWGLDLSEETLMELCAKLGADVPFFIRGGLQLAEGFGEVLTPIEKSPFQTFSILLVKPSFQVSTAWAYSEINKYLRLPANRPKFRALSTPINWQLFENDFERVLLSTYPEVEEIKATLHESGAKYACLSGSGSTMFGIFDHHTTAERAAMRLSAHQTYVTHPVVPSY